MDVYFIVYIVCIGCGHFAAGSYTVERLGCYRDYHPRILPLEFHLHDNNPSKCIAICFDRGFQLAGLQYTHHCFCGNAVPTSKINSSHCDMPCPQNSSLKCGGSMANDVYRILLTTQNLGCYRDSIQEPLLSGHHSYLIDNSPSKCIDLCIENDFLLAGVQNTHHCFCGNAVPSRKILDKHCDMPCPQDSSLKCGGYLATNVYRNGRTIPPTTVPTTMSPEETECMEIMDWKSINVVMNNDNTCQYRCINKYNKKAISIFKTDGEFCNNGKGICIKDVCHDTSLASGCPEGFQGVKKTCKMHCYNVLDYCGRSVVMNIKDGHICINHDDQHGTCLNGKCFVSLEVEKDTTSEM